MTRKPLIITISVAILIILGAVGWYFYSRNAVPAGITSVTGGLPFGAGTGNVSPGTPGGETASNPGVSVNGKPSAKLFRISDTPAAGFVSFLKGGFTYVRYLDRATGHIYDVNPATLEKIQITNNTLPKIYEAYFKSDASGAVIRSLKEGSDVVETSILTLTPPKATSTAELYTVASSILRGNIGEIGVASDNSLLYATNDTGAIIRSAFNGEKPVTLFSSAFTDWRISPSGIATTKAGANALGYSYILGSKGGLSKLLGPLSALVVAPSKDGKHIAYSYKDGDTNVLRSLNLTTSAASEIVPGTLAEKCAWSARSSDTLYCGVPVGGIGALEPDAWYQGSTHFSDRIWRFNASTGFTDVLVDPKKDFNTEIDIENPALTPDEDYLVFMNKSDLTIWALKLD
ncbi:MAG: hypothetical protein JWN89_588 [Parcubacteria group bacterium]|nr:hypothetical protein [Parcubacteria group bacterium]